MNYSIRLWTGLLLSSGCMGSGTEALPPSDCIVSFGVPSAVFARIADVQVIEHDPATTPTDLPPTCSRVLAAGYQLGAITAEAWACSSRAPDAVLSVDALKGVAHCDQVRPIPVLRYHRFPQMDQREETVQKDIATWRSRNRASDRYEQVDDGDLYCRTWSGDAPTAQCLLPASKQWPQAAKATHYLGDPGPAAWRWATEAWAK